MPNQRNFNQRKKRFNRESRDDLNGCPCKPRVSRSPRKSNSHGGSCKPSLQGGSCKPSLQGDRDDIKIKTSLISSLVRSTSKENIISKWTNRCLNFDTLREALATLLTSNNRDEEKIIMTWIKANIDKALNLTRDTLIELDEDDEMYDYKEKSTVAIMKIMTSFQKGHPMPFWMIIIDEFFKVKLFKLKQLQGYYKFEEPHLCRCAIYAEALIQSLFLYHPSQGGRWTDREFLKETSWLISHKDEIASCFKLDLNKKFESSSSLEKVIWLSNQIFSFCSRTDIKLEGDEVRKSGEDL